MHKTTIQLLTIFLFLNLNIYLPGAGFFPFPAYLIDVLIFSYLLIYYRKKNIRLPLDNIFFLWLLYFFTLNIIYFIFSEAGMKEFKLLKIIIFAIIVYIYMILLFTLDDKNLTTTRKTLIFIAPIVAFTLGLDYFNPGVLAFNAQYQVIQGRAASFYANANYAGTTMIIFLILGIDMVEKKFRTLFLLVIFLGLFFTMSRSNLLTFFLIVTILFFQGKLYTKQLIFSLSIIIFFFIWLSTGGLDYLSNQYGLEVTDNMRSRVDFFAENSASNTDDMIERKEILHEALDMFRDSPLIGQGFGSTLFWDHPVGPHNTFAMLWADQGLFGLLLIPLLFYFTTYNIFKYGDKGQKQLAVLFIIAYGLSCIFAHTRLFSITAIAFITAIAAMGYNTKKSYLQGES